MLANQTYFNITDSNHKIELEFEQDVEPMISELIQKWTDRQHELEQNTRSAKSQQVIWDIQVRSLEEQKRQLKSKSEINVKNDMYMSKDTLNLQD